MSNKRDQRTPRNEPADRDTIGNGGELHRLSPEGDAPLSTNQGVTIADDQNSLRIGERGPTLLEDFILREKITHFDHERIPERVVHARGYGAHGFFEPYEDHSAITRAAFLRDPSTRTPVFVRFSTVAGNKGSFDTARDVRGFATKFYTEEGIFDLVGNNIPVFFIQDAIKFPDLIHSVKPEPDRAFPQAQSAHDTFWDFVSLTPESTHMLLWAMSDRAIPRSFRMMEGFGVHTFRFVNDAGEVRFVKFHWRPKLGSFALIWDEALKINGADPDFHRRDLWTAIENGDFPEYELSVQVFDQETADGFDFDILDPTKIVPEELVPLTPLGRMVLDRNVDNFFDETEQVAFCPSHIVPGIDFSDDPLLQGRLFSYLDTQLSRLGSPNFHELPINRPKNGWQNLQQGGHMRHRVYKGRVSYNPSSLEDYPRESPERGFDSVPRRIEGAAQRIRSASFRDHYSQARQFWISQTPPEQDHIVNGFAFELGKVETIKVRTRMLGHLRHVHEDLAARVADALGMPGQIDDIEPAAPVREDVPPSPPLSMIATAPLSIKGRKIGVLVADGIRGALLDAIKAAVEAEGAMVEFVAPKVGGFTTADGSHRSAHHALSGAPSVIFDAVIVAPGRDGVPTLAREAATTAWIHDAFGHLKVIGYVPDARDLLHRAHVEDDDGVIQIGAKDAIARFINAAKRHRIWDREPTLRTPG
ncbi:MAG: catalase [bacterium]